MLCAQVYAYVLKILAGYDRPVLLNCELVEFEGLESRRGSDSAPMRHLDPRPFGPVKLPKYCQELVIAKHYGRALMAITEW